MPLRPVLLPLALLLAAVPAWADSGLALYLAGPSRPGRLEDCERALHALAPESWSRVTWPLRLRWQGGATELNPEARQPAGELREYCFRLDLDGNTLVWGAVVSRYSARYLNFPVLLSDADKGAREVLLKPSLVREPAGQAEWRRVLTQRFSTIAPPDPKP